MTESPDTLEMMARWSEEQRDDRWAFTSEQFGFTVYGRTRAKADEAFAHALIALINSFGDVPLLREFLDKKGVQHRFARESQGPITQRQRQFEVQLGETR